MSYRIIFRPSFGKLNRFGISTTSTFRRRPSETIELTSLFQENRPQILHSTVTWASREQRLRDLAEHFDRLNQASDEQVDVFYAAWVEDVVQRAVESLAADYCRKGRVDYLRVLYGRLCQGLTIAEAAKTLEVSPAAIDHYFRHAKKQLAEKLEQLARRQVQSYCPAEEAEQEYVAEWQRLGQYLAEHGGLEEAVRQAYDLFDPVQAKKHKKEAGLTKAATRLTSIIRSSSNATVGRKPT